MNVKGLQVGSVTTQFKFMAPELRFDGFTGAWEEKRFDELLTVNSGRDYKHLDNGTIPVYGTGGYMLSVDEKLSDVDGVGIGRKGTIDKPQYLKAPYWTVDTLFYLTMNMGFDLRFFYTMAQRIDWKMYNEATGVPSLSKTVIENIEQYLPDYNEQAAIGNFFRNLDDTIALKKQQCEQTANVKKAMLEKMFPKKGADVPEIRFDGFTGAWETKLLSDVANIIGGGTPSTSVAEYWGGNIDWYSPIEIGDRVYADKSQRTITELGLSKCSAAILPTNRTILFTSRAGIGDMAILTKDAATNQGFQSLVMKAGYDVYFTYSMGDKIKDYALRNASGSTFLEISGKMLGLMPILFPSIDEQIAIGNFFRSLDTLIETQQQELKKLQNIKKACLDKMFVQ